MSRVDCGPLKVSVCSVRGEGRDQRVCLTQTGQDSVHDLQVQVQLLIQHGKIPARGSAEAAALDVYAAHPSGMQCGVIGYGVCNTHRILCSDAAQIRAGGKG